MSRQQIQPIPYGLQQGTFIQLVWLSKNVWPGDGEQDYVILRAEVYDQDGNYITNRDGRKTVDDYVALGSTKEARIAEFIAELGFTVITNT